MKKVIFTVLVSVASVSAVYLAIVYVTKTPPAPTKPHIESTPERFRWTLDHDEKPIKPNHRLARYYFKNKRTDELRAGAYIDVPSNPVKWKKEAEEAYKYLTGEDDEVYIRLIPPLQLRKGCSYACPEGMGFLESPFSMRGRKVDPMFRCHGTEMTGMTHYPMRDLYAVPDELCPALSKER